MKKLNIKTLLVVAIILLTMNAPIIASINYFGSNGYNFTPSAWINKEKPYGVAVDAKMKFFSLNYVIPNKDLEIGLASSAGWTGANGYEKKTYVVPIVPSIKLGIIHDQAGITRWGYSIGLNMPYGLYNTATVHLAFPFLQPEFSLGIGMPSLDKFYIFGASQVMIANRSGVELPFGFIGEGAWGATGGVESAPLERYFALGTILKLGHNMSFNATYRKDPIKYTKEIDGIIDTNLTQNKDGEVRLRLIWKFNGIKNAAKRGVK